MYVNVVFVVRCLYGAVSLTLVREQCFIRIIIIIIHVMLIDLNLSKGHTRISSVKLIAVLFQDKC